jgi:hypothetical protein
MKDTPEEVARVADLMSSFRPTWSLIGGWGIDSWLGFQTRYHDDVDIAVFEPDQGALFAHLDGWLLVAHDEKVPDDTTEPWSGRRLHLPAHVHARSTDDLRLEILFNERTDGEWLLSRDPRITMPVHRSIRRSGWGLPTTVPEVLLWYKATAYFNDEEMSDRRDQDERDFIRALPTLTPGALSWVAEALHRAHPSHPWIKVLSGEQPPGDPVTKDGPR